MKNASFRAQLVARRTYNRPKNDIFNSFETWEETISRVILHQSWLWERAKGSKLTLDELNELNALRQLLLDRKVMVAGRTLWLGGTEVTKRREATQFNCSYLNIRTIQDVVDAYWLLMQGCGVGFSPVVGILSGFATPIEIEVIRSNNSDQKGREHNVETYQNGEWTISVGDSAEAWVKAVGKLFANKKPTKKLILDFSQIRKAGIRLRGYGWISSGDETISVAFPKIAQLLSGASSRLLTKIEILDILNWLGTTLSSRRSAEISLLAYGDKEIDDFIGAKGLNYWNDNPQRAQSNNSIIFNKRPSKSELKGIFATIIENGGGEPGFINGEAALKRAPYFNGVNPCVPGNTLILTSNGYVPIKDVVGQSIQVWNGKQFSNVVPFSTGINSLVKVNFNDGTNLICTPNHKFVLKGGIRKEANALYSGDKLAKFDMPFIENGTSYNDGYSQGFYAGDGNEDSTKSWLYWTKYCVSSRLKGVIKIGTRSERRIWEHGPMFDKFWVPLDATSSYALDWLAGLLDSDGSVLQNPNSQMLQICSINKKFLDDVRLMLTRLGVQAKVNMCRDEGEYSLPDGKGDNKNYICQTVYRLCINSTDTAFLVSKGLNCSRLKLDNLKPQRDARRFVSVDSVETLTNSEETFCFTDPLNNTGTFNGIVTGQCAEILLGDKSFCNLIEINLPAFNNDWNGLINAVRIIARANYRQTCVDLRDGILQDSWHELNNYLRLTGVGLTGIISWEHWGSPNHFKALKNIAKASVDSMAEELSLPKSQNVTTVKPSGTLSKIMDTTEGIHKPLGQYIFNNIVFSKNDELIPILRASNYHIIDHPLDSSSVLVRVPIYHGDLGFRLVAGTPINVDTAIQQLERYKFMMDNYVDHNCSITVSYDPKEVPAIVDWLHKNWDSYVGVSWLFRNDPTKTAADLGFAYLPQEVVTAETFNAYASTLKEVNIHSEHGSDNLDLVDDGCASGMCPIR